MAAKKKINVYRGVLNTIGATTATFDIALTTDAVVGLKSIIILHDTSSTNEAGGYSEIQGWATNNSGVASVTTASPISSLDATLAAATVVSSREKPE